MSKVAGCGAIALAMIVVVGACSSNGGKGGTGGAGAGGSGAGGRGAGGEEGIGGVGGGMGGTGAGGMGAGGHADSGAGGMGMGGQAGHSDGGLGGQDAGPTDAIVCCPPDPNPSRDGTAATIGSVHMGGATFGAIGCGLSYDFFCTTNWRLEPDQYGCPIWRYDIDHSGNCITGLDGAIYHIDAGDAANDVASGN